MLKRLDTLAIEESNNVEYYPPKFFKWEKVGTGIQRGAILKVKDKKIQKSYKQRFVALYYNYLLIFETGKGKKGEPTDKNAEAKAALTLETVMNISNDLEKEKEGYYFVITTEDNEWSFLSDTEVTVADSHQAIKGSIDQLRKAEPRVSSEESNRRIKEIQSIFPESNFKIPYSVIPSEADKYISDMKRFVEECKKWNPYMHSLNLFVEYQSGRIKGYHQWFTNKSKGVEAQIANSEEIVLKDWTDKITNAPKEMQKATETMFFLEDLQPIIDEAERTVQLVDIYNRYQWELNQDQNIKFGEEKQLITAWIQKLKSYPNSQDVSMNSYSDAKLDSEEESWGFLKNDFRLKRLRTDHQSSMNEDIEWTCKDHHCQFVNQLYGIVLWNGKSFVWTHPRCPFIIRYDWYATKGVFKQYVNPEAKGKQPPSLTDWQFTKDTMRAVTVGKRDPTPEVPEITSWTVRGNPPPPVVLLIATFRAIRPIVRGLLRMPD